MIRASASITSSLGSDLTRADENDFPHGRGKPISCGESEILQRGCLWEEPPGIFFSQREQGRDQDDRPPIVGADLAPVGVINWETFHPERVPEGQIRVKRRRGFRSRKPSKKPPHNPITRCEGCPARVCDCLRVFENLGGGTGGEGGQGPYVGRICLPPQPPVSRFSVRFPAVRTPGMRGLRECLVRGFSTLACTPANQARATPSTATSVGRWTRSAMSRYWTTRPDFLFHPRAPMPRPNTVLFSACWSVSSQCLR